MKSAHKSVPVRKAESPIKKLFGTIIYSEKYLSPISWFQGLNLLFIGPSSKIDS